MLEVRDLHVGYYKDLNILRGVNLTARSANITAVLGANGVGKSTLLKALYGFLAPNKGQVLLDGEDVTGVPTYELINLGMSYIPQNTGIFRWMSVEENLMMGGWTFRKDKKRLRRELEKSYERFPALKEKRRQQAGDLSGGQQRMIEVARTLMTDPKVILVDEPTAGLAKLLSQEVYRTLVALSKEYKLTLVLVDQEIREALKIADYVYVLELGRNKFEGEVEEFTDLEKAFWV
jgi:branched-chain amino acid transport system ATP-binding protein